ncbi:MAG: long-chain fatty acid--CoA ligase [Micrococcales bacterium]|nr:MAG: long-chain fatty acid--CoA ligase [Micrococcales bacterium]PIE27464.1 MAG: long-chain fatty acid--CoA ligase [Micrococcales bacterium]
MREASTPLLVTSHPSRNMTDLVCDWATEDPAAAAFYRKTGPAADRWEPVTISDFRNQAMALAKGLMASGIEVGDRVALMSRTRYEWTLIDVAVWFAGAVTVPVYETSSAEQAEWILSDSGTKALFVETQKLRDSSNLDAILADEQTAVQHLWVIDEDLESVKRLGKDMTDEQVHARRRTRTLNSPATVIYTSGTTGKPKGCVLTHGNFYELSVNTAARLADVVAGPESRTLLLLPLAHIFARFIQALVLAARCPMAHTPDPSTAVDDLGTFRPTYILSVPRIFEKIYNAAEQKAASSGQQKIFRIAAATAVAYSRSLDKSGPSLGLRAKHTIFDKLVYSKLRTRLGGRLQYAVSGGGPLGERFGHFYRGCGITILEGYGLTETTAPTCVNVPEAVKIGSVGLQLPGASVKLGEDNEILLKGPHVFTTYWGNEQATREAHTEDGWFRTGDIGSLDEDGFLYVTGRIKDIIVTAGGKNVAPAMLEDRLRSHPLVSQCVVVGDGRPFIGALITLDEDMLPTWLANHGLPEMSIAEAAEHPRVRQSLQVGVDRANKAVSRAESIRKFQVVAEDFTVESGHLTPSMKIKRAEVLKDHETDLERLYAR